MWRSVLFLNYDVEAPISIHLHLPHARNTFQTEFVRIIHLFQVFASVAILRVILKHALKILNIAIPQNSTSSWLFYFFHHTRTFDIWWVLLFDLSSISLHQNASFNNSGNVPVYSLQNFVDHLLCVRVYYSICYAKSLFNIFLFFKIHYCEKFIKMKRYTFKPGKSLSKTHIGLFPSIQFAIKIKLKF
jgi:hypothetical protein